jgi:hypothetical protein
MGPHLTSYCNAMPVLSTDENQEGERSCICVRGIATKPVPSQEDERSCICVSEVSLSSLYQARKTRQMINIRLNYGIQQGEQRYYKERYILEHYT